MQLLEQLAKARRLHINTGTQRAASLRSARKCRKFKRINTSCQFDKGVSVYEPNVIFVVSHENLKRQTFDEFV